MKYETEINEILNITFPKESWMTYEEHKEIIEKAFNQIGINKQKLSDSLEVGVKNGYSVEQQIEMIKQLIHNWEKQK